MAGRKNRYGYQEYRGRSGVRTVLIFIIALLAVLLAVLLAAGVVFMAVLGDYIEYTDTGVKINMPWREEEPLPPPVFSDPVVIVSDDVVVTVGPSEEPEPTPTLTSEPQYEPIGAVTVSAAQLRDGSAAQVVAAAGGNALVVEMKNGSGDLVWQSQTAMAASLEANGNERTAQAVRDLADAGELYLVARVHCFKDPGLGKAWIGTLMTRGGNVWYDRIGVCWSSPASQQAVDYLSALCLELADMGFDEILLDDAGYPNDGQVSVLAYGDNRPEDLTGPVSAFLERISGELAERGVILSVYANETLGPGDAVYSGLTAGVLAEHADRVWLDKKVSVEQYQTLLTAAGMADAGARIVVPDGLTVSGSWYR